MSFGTFASLVELKLDRHCSIHEELSSICWGRIDIIITIRYCIYQKKKNE
jgi:hypothetical protein